MEFKINLIDGSTFSCFEDETILNAALRNKIFLDYSCTDGRCKTCIAKLKSGKIKNILVDLDINDQSLKDYILTCISTPTSDLILETENLGIYGLVESKVTPARIHELTLMNQNLLRLSLRFPDNFKLNFLPGQYANLIIDGVKRSYSISSPNNSQNIEFLIKLYSDGEMSNKLRKQNVNNLVRVELPKGTFFLRENKTLKNLIFIATGTGIAPIKSILTSDCSSIILNSYENVFVLWGLPSESDLFWQPTASRKINYFPVYSRGNTEKKKYIQHMLPILDINFKDTAIYACGLNNMITEAKEIALSLGLDSKNFYSDVFLPSN